MGYGVCFLENKKGALLGAPFLRKIVRFAILSLCFELGIQVWPLFEIRYEFKLSVELFLPNFNQV